MAPSGMEPRPATPQVVWHLGLPRGRLPGCMKVVRLRRGGGGRGLTHPHRFKLRKKRKGKEEEKRREEKERKKRKKRKGGRKERRRKEKGKKEERKGGGELEPT